MLDVDPHFYAETCKIADELLTTLASVHGDVLLEVEDDLYDEIVTTLQALSEYDLPYDTKLYISLSYFVIPQEHRHIPYHLHVLISQLKKTLPKDI